MNEIRIASIVEGDGEEKALPILLRRIIQEIDPSLTPVVPKPYKQPSGSMLKSGGVERAIEAVSILYPQHSILIIRDSDDHCPGTIGPQLLSRAKSARPDLHVSVVLAHREYEGWFLAAAESLAGKRRLPTNLAAPSDPEAIRDAKGWLSRQMLASNRYSPTQDQPALTALLDLHLAHLRSRSFRKLWKEVERILAVV